MGAGLSIQPLLTLVGTAPGHPVYAPMFSVLINTASLLLLALVLRLAPFDLRGLAALPSWMLTVGIIGAFVVLAHPRPHRAWGPLPRRHCHCRPARHFAGLDHYGLLGVPEHRLDLTRLLGVACLITGVVLIHWR